MKHLFKLLALMLFVPVFALAEEMGAIAAPSQAEINAFLEALGGWKTLGTLGAIAVIIQGLMIMFRTKLGEFAGKHRLSIVLVLTFVSGVVALRMQGIDWIQASLHPVTLGSFQVLFHQIMKQYFSPKGKQ